MFKVLQGIHTTVSVLKLNTKVPVQDKEDLTLGLSVCHESLEMFSSLVSAGPPEPAILDWYIHCMCLSVNKVGGSGGMLPHEN